MKSQLVTKQESYAITNLLALLEFKDGIPLHFKSVWRRPKEHLLILICPAPYAALTLHAMDRLFCGWIEYFAGLLVRRADEERVVQITFQLIFLPQSLHCTLHGLFRGVVWRFVACNFIIGARLAGFRSDRIKNLSLE